MSRTLGDAIYSSTNSIFDPNNLMTQSRSLNKSTNSNNFVEDIIRVNHPYIGQEIAIQSLDPYRTQNVVYRTDLKIETKIEYLPDAEKKWAYTGTEENIKCGRFPHLDYCGCKFPCSLILDKISPIEVIPNLFCGPIECAYKLKELLSLKIGYILNCSCIAYTKRKRFQYFDIFINDNHTENAIKFFKITNRFIADALDSGNKILIHSENGQSRCWVFLMAYLIGRKGKKFSEAYDLMKEKFSAAEPNDNYLTQLKHYDLEVNI